MLITIVFLQKQVQLSLRELNCYRNVISVYASEFNARTISPLIPPVREQTQGSISDAALMDWLKPSRCSVEGIKQWHANIGLSNGAI